MALYPTGAGQTYLTIADAIAAVVAAVGGTPSTELHEVTLYGGATFTETVTVPSYPSCSCTRGFPLVIRTADSESTATVSGNIVCADATCGIRFQDITKSGGSISGSRIRNDLSFVDCDTTVVAGTITGISNYINFSGGTLDIDNRIAKGDGSYMFSFDLSDIEVRTNDTFFDVRDSYYFGMKCRDVRFTGAGFIPAAGAIGVLIDIDIEHSSFDITTDLIGGSAATTGRFVNNIVDGANNVLINTNSFNLDTIEFDGNRYYNCTTILNATIGTNYADLAAMQAAGQEANGSEGDPGFASTTWGNADFLKLLATLGTAKNVGSYVDQWGGKRQSYSNIDPGAHQYADATEGEGGGAVVSIFKSIWG